MKKEGVIKNMIIRQAVLNDCEAISTIEALCFPAAEAASKAVIIKRLETFSTSFFVAEIDGQVVGFINGAITQLPELLDELYTDASLHQADGAYQTIFGLDVHPTYQHQGIASKLMNHMIDLTRKRKKKGIILTCKEHLIPFYEGFGYINQGQSSSTHGNAIWYSMLLEF